MCPGFDTVLVFHQIFKHDLHFCFNVVCGLIIQIKEMLMVWVVLVLFKLKPGVFHVAHLNLEPHPKLEMGTLVNK